MSSPEVKWVRSRLKRLAYLPAPYRPSWVTPRKVLFDRALGPLGDKPRCGQCCMRLPRPSGRPRLYSNAEWAASLPARQPQGRRAIRGDRASGHRPPVLNSPKGVAEGSEPKFAISAAR